MKDFKPTIAKPRVIALHACLTIDDYVSVFEVHTVGYDETFAPLPEGQTRERALPGWVRISEPVEIKFTAVDNDSIVRHAVESLNEEERKIVDEMNKKLADIRGRKNQLLSLTHEVTP